MKRAIVGAVVGIWVLFSVGYILYDMLQDFKTGQLQQAFIQGKAEAVNKLLESAAKCQPFNVHVGDKKVDLINVECLQAKKTEPAKESVAVNK